MPLSFADEKPRNRYHRSDGTRDGYPFAECEEGKDDRYDGNQVEAAADFHGTDPFTRLAPCGEAETAGDDAQEQEIQAVQRFGKAGGVERPVKAE